jgi:hypothetical protein
MANTRATSGKLWQTPHMYTDTPYILTSIWLDAFVRLCFCMCIFMRVCMCVCEYEAVFVCGHHTCDQRQALADTAHVGVVSV